MSRKQSSKGGALKLELQGRHRHAAPVAHPRAVVRAAYRRVGVRVPGAGRLKRLVSQLRDGEGVRRAAKKKNGIEPPHRAERLHRRVPARGADPTLQKSIVSRRPAVHWPVFGK